jgi:cytochrome P450
MPARRYPPGPSTLRALRGLKALGGGRDLAEIPVFLAETAQRFPGIAHWVTLRRHFFFLDDPALIEEAFVLRARDYRKGRGIERLKRLVGNGLLSSEEPLHLRQRRMIQPAFHKERITAYGRTMVAATVAQLDSWPSEAPLELDAEMTRLTLAIAAQTLFSTDVAGQTDAIRAALTTALRAFPASLSRLSELLDALPILPAKRRFARARAQLDAVIYGLIADRRADPAAPHDDLLAMLLQARDGEAAMDDVQVRDEALTLFLAGHETTANALAWTWYLLARHPHVADKLRAELDSALGTRPPEASDVPHLPFTRDVFAETLRLYPPAWILGRRALRETAVGPWTVPRGSVVIASQLVTQRSARYWRNPDAFAPERWSTEPAAPRFAYFPFGGGNRRCIGESFAWMEGVLIIATVAQRYRFTVLDPAPVDTEPLVTLRPRTPIRLLASARVPAAATDCDKK